MYSRAARYAGTSRRRLIRTQAPILAKYGQRARTTAACAGMRRPSGPSANTMSDRRGRPRKSSFICSPFLSLRKVPMLGLRNALPSSWLAQMVTSSSQPKRCAAARVSSTRSWLSANSYTPVYQNWSTRWKTAATSAATTSRATAPGATNFTESVGAARRSFCRACCSRIRARSARAAGFSASAAPGGEAGPAGAPPRSST
mmetsp:Transcript_6633/g.18736  ORF Transcript_6633/g.18736 Transcript_6633/m.18736 type:complete len:201 (+) Transcript_6633:233-835(+)